MELSSTPGPVFAVFRVKGLAQGLNAIITLPTMGVEPMTKWGETNTQPFP